MKRRLRSPQKRVNKATTTTTFCKATLSSCANPTIWIGLIGASFLLNVLLAVATLSQVPLFPKSAHDAAVSSFLSFASNREHLLSSGWVEESEFWRRLYLLQNATSKHDTRRNSTSCKSYMEMDSSPFPTFQQRLRQYYVDQMRSDPRVENAAPENQCWLPPPALCQEQQYSVVVYSRLNAQGSVNWRQLFLSLLSFQSYPSVADITLLLPFEGDLISLDSTTNLTLSHGTNIKADIPYISRLANWHRQHNIQIHAGTSFWELLPKLQPQQASLIWIDGDVVPPKDWNGTLVRNMFHQWRQDTRSSVLMHPYSRNLHGMFMDRSILCLVQNHPTLFVQPLRQIQETVYTNKTAEWQSTLTALWFLWSALAPPPQRKVPFVLQGGRLEEDFASSHPSQGAGLVDNAVYHKHLAEYFACSSPVYIKDDGPRVSRNLSESSWLCDDHDGTIRSPPFALHHPFLRGAP